MGKKSQKYSVRVVLASINEVIGGGPQITVHVEGSGFYSNSERELVVHDDDENDTALFGQGEWRYAQLVPVQPDDEEA